MNILQLRNSLNWIHDISNDRSPEPYMRFPGIDIFESLHEIIPDGRMLMALYKYTYDPLHPWKDQHLVSKVLKPILEYISLLLEHPMYLEIYMLTKITLQAGWGYNSQAVQLSELDLEAINKIWDRYGLYAILEYDSFVLRMMQKYNISDMLLKIYNECGFTDLKYKYLCVRCYALRSVFTWIPSANESFLEPSRKSIGLDIKKRASEFAAEYCSRLPKDFILIVGDKSYKINKGLLQACSKYMEHLLDYTGILEESIDITDFMAVVMNAYYSYGFEEVSEEKFFYCLEYLIDLFHEMNDIYKYRDLKPDDSSILLICHLGEALSCPYFIMRTFDKMLSHYQVVCNVDGLDRYIKNLDLPLTLEKWNIRMTK